MHKGDDSLGVQSQELHPLRFAFNFLFKILYMNRNITEKVLGESTWPKKEI